MLPIDEFTSAIIESRQNDIDRLLDNGVNPNDIDSVGRTPLCLAARNGSTEIGRLLIAAGADTNTPDKLGTTPLDVAIYFSKATFTEMLLQNGADIQTGRLLSPIQIAAIRDDQHTVDRLVAHGADKAHLEPLSMYKPLSWTAFLKPSANPPSVSNSATNSSKSR